MANVFDVARYILDRLAPDADNQITTWKLQKLVYYAQAWSVVWEDQPLFDERIEAWANGPVCPPLYQRHAGRLKVSAGDIDGDPGGLAPEQAETVDVVLGHYAQHTAQYLSELTHAEAPWMAAREGLAPGRRGNREITPDSMAEYYGGL